MSLVAYESSGESDEENEAKVVEPSERPSMPSSLNSIGLDISWRALNKNRTLPIRIPAPVLKNDVIDEKKPKLKPSVKGSSLFSILPEPKNSYIKPAPKLKPPPPKPKAKPKLKPKPKDPDSDDEEIDSNSFFFLPETEVKIDEKEMKEIEKIGAVEEKTENFSILPQFMERKEIAGPSLDDEALSKLCGTKDRRTIVTDIVEVSGSDLIGDVNPYLANDKTADEEIAISESLKRKLNENPLSKKKHQITYLAQYAKATEYELKQQWAQNRASKQQTQSKYGF